MGNSQGVSVPIGCRRILFPDSSAVEQSAVNRLVVGSNPTLGASNSDWLAIQTHLWLCVERSRPIGVSPSGKARDFDSRIRRFKSYHPSH